MNAPAIEHAETFVRGLVGLRCVHAIFGIGGGGLDLIFGDELPTIPIGPAWDYEALASGASLLVWCSWRLESEASVITTSDDAANPQQPIRALIGTRLTAATIESPAFDIRLAFETGLRLVTFCEYASGSGTIDANWELRRAGKALYCEAGFQLAMEG